MCIRDSATPSYALYMAEVAERMDALKDIRLRVGLFGAEASTCLLYTSRSLGKAGAARG